MRKLRPFLVIVCVLLMLFLAACQKPVSVVSIEKTATNGNVDTYTIYYSNGDEYSFTVTNGLNGADGHTPTITIGENGNWFIDGVDSGVSAKGEEGEPGAPGAPGAPGEDGHTPTVTIGENGNWFIDGVDTGVSAKGEQGEPGEPGAPGAPGENGHTPSITIGENGNWFIDGVDTGVSATGGSTAPENPDPENPDPENPNPENPGEGTEQGGVTVTSADIIQGGYTNGAYGNRDDRICVNRLIPITAGTVVRYDTGSLMLYFGVVTGADATSLLQKSGWISGSGRYTVNKDGYLTVIARKSDSSDLTPADWDAEVTVGEDNTVITYEKRNVYKFGGAGNDWCFVYLPEDYDHDRAEPYRLVIANHGNGWSMNGNPWEANWTDITMYMSPNAPGYKAAKASRYILTEDESLWYSNPTIEALLDAGYVVAGTQNYGDSLYGNDNCRDACVDFFNHMVETYNVEDACYMIGASNGAMTTLNASYLLKEKVKAIIIQYPLTCLSNQYVAHPDHREGIEAAYGITVPVGATADDIAALIGHEFDPLYANVENGVKVGYFPATKIYYSLGDTTTPASANSLPLKELLEESGKSVEAVCVGEAGSGKGHGHVDHFDPEGYVEWFNQH